MVYDAEEYRKKRPLVLAGELRASVNDLWIMLYDLIGTSFIDLKEEKNQKTLEDAVTLFQMLLSAADTDDDEEMDIIFEALENMLHREAPVKRVLEMLHEADISFTELRYHNRELTDIRDYLLKNCFSLELAETMVYLGVDLNEPLIKGRTPAFILAYERNFEGAGGWNSYQNELDEAYAKLVETVFSVESMETLDAEGSSAAHWAVRQYKYRMLSAMLKKGVNVNLTQDQPSVAGTTLLHIACEYGFPEMVRLLMEAGADDTLQNEREETAAHMTVSRNVRYKTISAETRVEMIKLLEHVDIPGKKGITPLMAAQDYDLHASYILTPVFIEKGADVNRTDNAGNTALLLHAIWYCDKAVVKAMVNAGYEINARNKDGNTILHYAIKNKSSEAARYLLKKGADYTIVNEKQITPLQMAVENGLEEVLPLMGV
nr:ankyrin repeat domain-containing protein [uncultured Acetatifactor sp.]